MLTTYFEIPKFRVFELSVIYTELPWFTHSPIKSTTERNSKQCFASPHKDIIYSFQMWNTNRHWYMYQETIKPQLLITDWTVKVMEQQKNLGF